MLDSVVLLLPEAARPYAKAIVAALIAVLTIVATVSDSPSWLPAVLAVLGAPAVFATPNIDTPAPAASNGGA